MSTRTPAIPNHWQELQNCEVNIVTVSDEDGILAIEIIETTAAENVENYYAGMGYCVAREMP